MNDQNLDEESLSRWQQLQYNCKSTMPRVFYKEWQTMLGLQLVFNKTVRIGDTKYNF